MSHKPSTPALPADLKFGNRTQVMGVFKDGGEYTVNDISERVGLSRQTVMKAVQLFVQKGIIVSAGKGCSTSIGGKRPELFSLAPDKYLLSIELWPNHLRFVMLDLRCRIVARHVIKQPLSADPLCVLQTVGGVSERLLADNGIEKEQLYAVCVSTPGIVDYKTNRLKYSSLSPDWGINIPIADTLAAYFAPQTPIWVENVGKMTAHSLLQEKQLKDKRVLVVFSSWGLSGCFIDRGHILHGKNSLIGEIGHTILDLNADEHCSCSSAGSFEQLVGNDRLRRQVRSGIEVHPDSILRQIPLEELTVEMLFDASAKADAYARQLVSGLARVFAVALLNVSLTFDPDVVVFHGNYAHADEYFQAELRRYLADFQYYPQGGPFSLYLDPRPIEELNLAGSCAFLLDNMFNDVALYND